MAIDREFYNEASASKLGWEPQWFGCSTFDDRLTKAIRKFQRQNDLTADGLCGPTTFRRIWTHREANIDDYRDIEVVEKDGAAIVHNGKFFPIEWKKVVLWSDNPGGIPCKEGTYSSYAGHPDRKPSFFVTHWDVCLDSRSCMRVLSRRGISIHYTIDNDGTIRQHLDTQHAAWHAGGRKWNHSSIGVEISNAYSLKYQNRYVSRGFGERPIEDNAWVHGKKLKPFLGFYPVQLQALKALYKAINKATGIPLETPLDRSGNMLTKVSSVAKANKFKGFVSHYHLTNGKIDCAGLDIQKILEEIKNET
jgi:hypothetical protein